MRLLLDECVPRPLKQELATHDVHHVVDLGWAGADLAPEFLHDTVRVPA